MRRFPSADEGLQWLDQVLAEERLPSEPAKRGPSPLPRKAAPPISDTIEVDCRWLIPPLPEEARRKASETLNRSPIALAIAPEPRPKLPPPLGRPR
jgi:hypothetical protein